MEWVNPIGEHRKFKDLLEQNKNVLSLKWPKKNKNIECEFLIKKKSVVVRRTLDRQ